VLLVPETAEINSERSEVGRTVCNSLTAWLTKTEPATERPIAIPPS
jgi:hypothetical protein